MALLGFEAKLVSTRRRLSKLCAHLKEGIINGEKNMFLFLLLSEQIKNRFSKKRLFMNNIIKNCVLEITAKKSIYLDFADRGSGG
jgi:hypothetical protein